MLGFVKSLSGNAPSTNGHSVNGMLDSIPVAVMLCDPQSFTITYANGPSLDLLRSIRHLLKIDPERIVGTSIDVFHRDPSHQRRILSDPKNLPFKTQIRLGEEILDLHISPVFDRGRYASAMLTWNVVTAKVKADQESARLLRMLDEMPTAVMVCDPNDGFRITYMNRTSLATLEPLQQHLPVRAGEIVGRSIDIFHKAPEHQRRMLSDPRNLPHEANIRLGPEVLNLRVSPIFDAQGKYIAAMLTWSVVTSSFRIAESVTSVVNAMAEAAQRMRAAALEMVENAGSARGMASAVSAAVEEMAASIGEINQRMAQATTMTVSAVNEADQSDRLVSSLSDSAQAIGRIVQIINAIAGQTNLLALNATIEAARAGDAGKGFAVVANEVKSLATQTAKATEEISAQVQTIQGIAGSTVSAFKRIGDAIRQLHEISLAVSAAMEEQSAATQEVSRNVTGVAEAARTTGDAAQIVLDVSQAVSGQSTTLSEGIASFVKQAGR